MSVRAPRRAVTESSAPENSNRSHSSSPPTSDTAYLRAVRKAIESEETPKGAELRPAHGTSDTLTQQRNHRRPSRVRGAIREAPNSERENSRWERHTRRLRSQTGAGNLSRCSGKAMFRQANWKSLRGMGERGRIASLRSYAAQDLQLQSGR